MELNSQRSLLIISPHPDDLEIGMGGAAALAVREGARVISLVLTDGRRSPRSFACSDDEMAEIRQREVEAAAQVLGISELFCLRLPDLRGETQRARAEQELTLLLEKYSPTEFYLPHPELDGHQSHRWAAALCLARLTQLVEAGRINSPNRWAYEVWGLFPQWQRLDDISSVIDQKAAAIDCHNSQTRDIDYREGVMGLNRWRAVFHNPHEICPAKYAEAFIQL